jgi:hypothetical protein
MVGSFLPRLTDEGAQDYSPPWREIVPFFGGLARLASS